MIDEWETAMVTHGTKHCDRMKSGSVSNAQKLPDTYYDLERIAFQIADYTQDESWTLCAQAAEKVYRDHFLRADNAQAPGYWVFSHGLHMDYDRTGDAESKRFVGLLAINAAFAQASPWNDKEMPKAAYSRETAYALMTHLANAKLGTINTARIAQLAGFALGHIDQWANNQTFVKPFMAALTAEALIEYHARYDDSRVLPALEKLADYVWDKTWRQSAEAFLYIDRSISGEDPSIPAPDLNLLISPMFSWLWYQTGQVRFKDRHDAIWNGGVKRAWLAGAKVFNQSMRWSIQGLKWRQSK